MSGGEVRSVLLVGAGPVRIGRGPELATMAALATMALRRLGVRVVVVDPNPNALATELADVGYAEPIERDVVAAIAAAEAVEAVLPAFGGEEAHAIAARVVPGNVRVLGAPADALEAALDGARLREAARRAGLPVDGEPFAATARRVEIEAIREASGAIVVVGAVEYLTPPPVHVGDAVTVTLSADAVPAAARAAAEALLSGLAVVGAAGVRLSVGANDAVERVDSLRLGVGASSTLVAHAARYPFAEAAARATLGFTLSAIDPPAAASFRVVHCEPTFSFERFPGADTTLGPQMKRVGRSMSSTEVAFDSGARRPRAPGGAERRLLFVGAGPLLIGRGADADACVARGVLAAQARGFDVVVVDSNPDALAPFLADRFHAAPITARAVIDVCARENPDAVVLQLGGEPALALAKELEASGIALAGTSAAAVARARALVSHDRTESSVRASPKLGVELLTDGARAVLAGVYEYVERAAVHPGDSAAILPPLSVPEDAIRLVENAARAAACSLGARGLVSVEVALDESGQPVLLDVRAGAGAALPFVAKAAGRDLVAIALGLALGATVDELALKDPILPAHVAARECAFPFASFAGAEPGLGATQRSIGEAMSVGETLAASYRKALAGVGIRLERPRDVERSLDPARARVAVPPRRKKVVLVPSAVDRSAAAELARRLRALGFEILTDAAFGELLGALRIPHGALESDGVDGDDVALVVATTPTPDDAAKTKALRHAALASGVPCITTLMLARAACAALEQDGPSSPVRRLPASSR